MRQVAAAVAIHDGRIFIVRRPSGDPLAGCWELPGGKLEDGESPQACLVRELREELDVRAVVGELLATTVFHYAHGSFEMLALETTLASSYRLLVHDAAAWVTRSEIDEYGLAPADVDLLAQLGERGTW